jgi:hypothetical protein
MPIGVLRVLRVVRGLSSIPAMRYLNDPEQLDGFGAVLLYNRPA